MENLVWFPSLFNKEDSNLEESVKGHKTPPPKKGIENDTWGVLYRDREQINKKKKEIDNSLKAKGTYEEMQQLMTHYNEWEFLWAFIKNDDPRYIGTYKLRPVVTYLPICDLYDYVIVLPLTGEHDKDEQGFAKEESKSNKPFYYHSLLNYDKYGFKNELFLNIGIVRKLFWGGELNSSKVYWVNKDNIASKIVINEKESPLRVQTLKQDMRDIIDAIEKDPKHAYMEKVSNEDLKNKYYV